jgi:TonB family protein
MGVALAIFQSASIPAIAIPPPAPAPAPTQPSIVRAPEWLRRPSPEALLKRFPAKALAAGRTGMSTLECNVLEDGTLQACHVISETPGDYGFGEAALNLAADYAMAPPRYQNPLGILVRILIRWDPPNRPPSTLPVWPGLIKHPVWLSRPSGADIGRYYPPNALERGVTGRSTVDCDVLFDGTLTDCVVAAESPVDAGFGRASLRFIGRFRMAPQDPDGSRVEGANVHVSFDWRVDAPAPPTPPASAPPH